MTASEAHDARALVLELLRDAADPHEVLGLLLLDRGLAEHRMLSDSADAIGDEGEGGARCAQRANTRPLAACARGGDNGVPNAGPPPVRRGLRRVTRLLID